MMVLKFVYNKWIYIKKKKKFKAKSAALHDISRAVERVEADELKKIMVLWKFWLLCSDTV